MSDDVDVATPLDSARMHQGRQNTQLRQIVRKSEATVTTRTPAAMS